MKISPFKLERYFAEYEFSAPYLLSCSDCEPMTLDRLLSLADENSKALWQNLQLGYTEPQGHPLLREEVANLYSGVKSEHILIVVPQEGIFIAMNSMLAKGDHVIVTYPGYQSLYEDPLALGCEVSYWKPHESDRWSFDVDEVTKLIKHNTKAIIINFPHNPTGAMISESQQKGLIELASKHGIYIFSDEMYHGLEISTQKLPAICDVYERGISLFGVSKSFGLAGLRIGWLATRDAQLFEQFKAFKDYTSICASAPSEILALMALRSRDNIIEQNKKIIRKNLSILNDFVTRHEKLFSFIKPEAGSVCFPRLKTSKISSYFCNEIMTKTGIMLLPSDVFDYGSEHVRIGLGRKNMPAIIQKLDNYLKV